MKLPARLAAGYTFKGVWVATQIALLLVVAAIAAVQTVRLEGVKVWPFEREGWKPKAERLQAVIDDIDQAQELAAEAARQAKNAQEKRYRQLAERIDDDAKIAEQNALAAADRFIAANRLRCPPDRGLSGGAFAGATNYGAGHGDTRSSSAELDGRRGGGPDRTDLARTFAGPPELVAVAAEDVRICTANTLQAEAARRWALDLQDTADGSPSDLAQPGAGERKQDPEFDVKQDVAEAAHPQN